MRLELKQLRKETNNDLDCGCGIPGWHTPPNDFLTPLEKYKIPPHDNCPGCSIGAGLFEDNLHMLIRASYPRRGEAMRDRYFRYRNQYPRACRHSVVKIFKKETGFLKMGGLRITPYWREFCYWELAYGFVPYKKEEELEPEIVKWLAEPLVLGGPLGEERYLDMLEDEAIGFFETEWHMPRRVLGIMEWLSTGKWMEGKSGTGDTIRIQVEGRSVRSSRAKPIDGVLRTDAAIAAELITPTRELMVVMQKSEGGKIRPVVKTGNEVNRKMNYLSSVLEVGLHGSPLSTLFAGEKGNELIDYGLIRASRNNSLWKVPLDQGGFDQHQSKPSIERIFRAIGRTVIKRVAHPDITATWTALYESLFSKGARVILGNKEWVWQNGLPSGWRWTAILDTLLNIASFRVIKRVAAARLGRQIYIGDFHAQGDDVIFTATDLHAIQLIIDTYGKIGYEVHPMKTYISRTRGEFLRRSYEPEGVTGYLARSLLNIRYKNPIQSSPLTPGERLYSQLSQLHLVSLRNAKPDVCADMFVEWADQQRLDTAKAASYALTPNAVGGCGLDPLSAMGSRLRTYSDNKWYTMVVSKEMRTIKASLGAWGERFSRIGWVPEEGVQKELMRTLAMMWGIRESVLTGDACSKFISLDFITPEPPPGGDPLPDPHIWWDLDHVPVQLRGIIKRQAVANNQEQRWMVAGRAEELKLLKKRMSIRIYLGYLTEEWVHPAPLVDKVGPRYGAEAKRWANLQVRCALAVSNIGLKRLQGFMLWIELVMRRKLKELGNWALLAQ